MHSLLFICVWNLVLILRNEHRLRAFNISVMGKLGPNKEEIMGRWMKLHNVMMSV
jgi:hypothetical protein